MNTYKVRLQEKAISTDPELIDSGCNEYHMNYILASLINRKVISIKADINDAKLKSKIQPQLLVQRLAEKNSRNKRKLGKRRKGRCMHSCHKHHHHNFHHHHQHKHNIQNEQLFQNHHHHCDGIVRSDGFPGPTEEWSQNQKRVPYLGGHILTAALQRSTAGMLEDNRHFEDEPKTKIKRKNKRRKFQEDDRQIIIKPHPIPTIHPDDLPQRARWTIIITAGLLLITCMLLVGVTLRMAPVIDELVRNQNEELINSLDREEFGPVENNTEEMFK
ncbi:uncharacterized protein LOC126905794 [Daktulosphaira vitifoliae]|uniref:uncharacterized protein LOC126905794 n=1 Tax=Daktulosphaira vitifoliae TaxID=58002 RepID=UPI0021AAD46F|nr:uncharacterized protein LOC126905794 [Daktulosphaira vitifoliae]XP_050541812.1 uncharacterized protein LOC126905794 [Daktulosphaira vitifoliae]XP_050541813.1 uncharacterized protein LOC126905794 [Daktulosphaira vitifoliae]XP_050541814.1 uncharacterized protein LOC126905794 [Daktulosphaira vitifoliae]XP_050541815.1 uncharacterized protein LOC126905794 [Daktulosphaira vitifoliae]XP_050541816.1 uncharacterized protein LOC126905794 [Daktulosphaira vitifoliae]